MNKIEGHWDQFAKIYDQQSQCLAVMTLELWNMLRISQADSILEIGCGTGYLLPLLIQSKKETCKVTAIDISSEMVKLSTRRMDQHSPELKQVSTQNSSLNSTFTHYPQHNLSVGKANSEELVEFEDASFDVYSASLVLHLTLDHQKMLKEAHRVLKVGGRVGCSVWGRQENTSVFTILNEVLDQNGVARDKTARTPFHLNDRDKLIQTFRENNFSNLVCWYSIVPISVFNIDDFDFLVKSPSTVLLMATLSEELQAKIMSDLKAILDSKLKNCEPLTMEGLFITGYKL